jgi:hypothetical protein
MELTTKLMQAAVDFGSKVIYGRVCGLSSTGGPGSRQVTGVQVQMQHTIPGADAGADARKEDVLPAGKVVIATGPWAGVHAHDWLGLNIPMQVGFMGLACRAHKPCALNEYVGTIQQFHVFNDCGIILTLICM